MKKHHLLYSLLLLNISIYAQSSIKDSIVFAIKEFKIDKAKEYTKQLKNPCKQIITNKLNHIIYGQRTKNFSTKNLKNTKNKIIANLYYGDALLNLSIANDSLAFLHYKKALKIAEQKNEIHYKNICYQKICDVLMKNNFSNEIFTIYLNAYKQNKTDAIDTFWIEYYRLTYIILKEKKNKLKNTDFNLAYSLAKNNFYFQARILQLKGLYQANYISELELAEKNYNKAINLLKPHDYYIIKKQIKQLKFNKAIVIFYSKKYRKAIANFKNILASNSTKKEKLFTYHWLYKSYDSLKKKDSANYYYRKFNNLKEVEDKKGHAKHIVQSYYKGEIIEKNENISNLNSKLNTVLPILGIVLFLLTLLYFRYKKYHKKSENLEEEKSETLTKLEELKKIVIKNHIVLKDKTKIYIADLMYVKADDHYLKIYLSNGKNHFVRGKLTKIIEELPPNFIRCHRSYVVNRNYIKQINNTNIILTDKTELPLSRSYKDKLQ